MTLSLSLTELKLMMRDRFGPAGIAMPIILLGSRSASR
jgi:hypothetical protein